MTPTIGTVAAQATARRFLMCSPDNFDVTFQINPWMSTDRRPDPALSFAQWDYLAAAIEATGSQVFSQPSLAGLPDMVFPADVAVVVDGRFLRARFRHPERAGEAAKGAAWLTTNGFIEMAWPDEPDVYLEGGDVLAFGDILVAGHGMRTTAAAHRSLSGALGRAVVSVNLIEPSLYHLDMSFCPLDAEHAIVAPHAWDKPSRRLLADLVPAPLVVSTEEAATFCVNSVVVGRTVLMPACPPRVGRTLVEWGFTPFVVDVAEFIKAGGGIRCMTLDLDLAPQRGAAASAARVPAARGRTGTAVL